MKDFKLKLRELTLSPDRVLGIADEKCHHHGFR